MAALRIVLMLSLAGLFSCRASTDEGSGVAIHRYDKALCSYLSDALADSVFFRQYGDFHRLYTEAILELLDSGCDKSRLADRFSAADMQLLCGAVDSIFPDLSDVEAELSAALARYRHLLPDDTLPARFYAHVSGLRQQIVNAGDMLSVSLDHYLGSGYPPYASIYPRYRLEGKKQAYIVPDVLRVILYTRHPLLPVEHTTLLREMIYEGKIVYSLQQLLPDVPPERLLGYTPEQLAWCRENESEMWNALLREKTLYAASPLTIERYLSPAPFTAPFSPQSPGQAGRYIGWRIVSAYAGATHADLTRLWQTDETEITKKAKYKG